ncbi:MAG: hypothetical protein K0Q91_2153 [Fibrobacteria bacterium]|jgi:hypothetical protein|nr:hypothetical protein [Fibrobacteria bacterium]
MLFPRILLASLGLIATVLGLGCAGPKGRPRGLFAPTNIAHHPLDISRPNAFTFKADLKVDAKPYIAEDSIVGPYHLGIYSEKFKGVQGRRLWDSLEFVTVRGPDSSILEKIHQNRPQFIGRIRLTWTSSDGSREVHDFEGYGGSPRDNSVLVGSKTFTWLRYHKNQRMVDLKVEVLNPDTNLAKVLGKTQLWINRGGGK